MTTFDGAAQRATREARVGDYRRGSRVRTTPAGTWFPAVGPKDEPAGLLLVHPGVDTKVLLPTLRQLAELGLPGVLPSKQTLTNQAGRNWLAAEAPPIPALADLLDEGPQRQPANAAAVLTDLAHTLIAVHEADLAHGRLTANAVVIGLDGSAMLTDWGTNPSASQSGDIAGWTQLARLLAEKFCAEAPEAAAALARAAGAAVGNGLAAGCDQLRELADAARRDVLAQVAAELVASGGRPRPVRRRPAPPPLPPELAELDQEPASPAESGLRTTQPPATPYPGSQSATGSAPAAATESPTGQSPTSAPPGGRPRAPEQLVQSATPTAEPDPTTPATPTTFDLPGPMIPSAPTAVPGTEAGSTRQDGQPGPTSPFAPDQPFRQPPVPNPYGQSPSTRPASTSTREPAPANPTGPNPAGPNPAGPNPTGPNPTGPSPADPSPAGAVPASTGHPPSDAETGGLAPNTALSAQSAAEPRTSPIPVQPGPHLGAPGDRTRPTTWAAATSARPQPPQPQPGQSQPGQSQPGQPHPGQPQPGHIRPSWQQLPPTPPKGQSGTVESIDRSSALRAVLIGLLVVAIAVASALLYLRVQQQNSGVDLRVDSVTLQASPRGSMCMLYASLITNGESGTLTYRWSGDRDPLPVMSVSVGDGQKQLVVGRQWSPDPTGGADPPISIQLLSPTPRTAHVQPTRDCQ